MFTVYTGVKVFAVCVVVTLTTTARAFEMQPPPQYLQQHENGKSGFPCPDENDISPCTCVFDTSGILDLSCVGLTKDEFDKVFQAEFPFTKFNSFVLKESDIPILENGVFGKVNFRSLLFEFNNMTTVEDGALGASYNVLQEFTFYEDPADTTYTWPLTNIASFQVLENISISGPYAAMDPLVSTTLANVVLGLYEMTSLPASTFSGAPNIRTLLLQDTKLENIEPNTFEPLKQLEILEITGASLSTLVESSMTFTSENLADVNLSRNKIADVKGNAFSGPLGNTVVDLSYNMFMELKSEAFSSLLSDLTSGYVDVGNNPLLCGCDLTWLLYLEEDERTRLHGLETSCDIEGSFNFDDLVDFLMYQCSTSSSF